MNLDEINEKRQKIFESYRRGEIDRAQFLSKIRPLDVEADRLEMSCISNRPSEKEPSKLFPNA